jgi:pimeloyl-ACP methyl ester carboxylesterase
MVYGFTMAGEKELRLVRFAQSFASFGFRVVVPDLPGLKSLDLVAGDLEMLISMIPYLHCDSARSIGLVGFSVGGGIALTAAANPNLWDKVDPILLFGPHYSLPDLWTGLWQVEGRFPETEDEWDDFIWRQLTLAYRQRRVLGFNDAEETEIVDLLRTYCSKPLMKHKREVYERLVRPHGLLTTRCEKVDLDILECLSPRGKLGMLKSKVLILHDSHDSLIPPSQSQYMLIELKNRSLPHSERLVITPLLSHVNPHAMLNLPDLLAILDVVGELFIGSSKV